MRTMILFAAIITIILCAGCGQPAPLAQEAGPAEEPAAGAPAPLAANTPTADESAPAAAPDNVILISWDGLDRSVVMELLLAGRLPSLEALLMDGVFQPIEVRGHVTVTKPGHAEMLTGLDVKDTGVVSNSDFRPIPGGFTVFERLQAALGGPAAIRTIFVSSKIAHVGGRGPEELKQWASSKKNKKAKVPEGADDTVISEGGEPFFLTRSHLDVFDSDQRDAAVTGPLCLQYLAANKDPRFFAFLHFSDPDHNGHAHGIDSAEYRTAAEACDLWLGKAVQWLKDERLYDRTLVYVTADHGFDEHGYSHMNAPHAWLVTNDTSVKRGGILADIPATILTRFGIDTHPLTPALIGTDLAGDPPADRPDLADTAPPAIKDAAFEAMDQDRDGILTPAEFKRSHLFEQADTDRDGRVTRDEFNSAVSRLKEFRKSLQEKRKKDQ